MELDLHTIVRLTVVYVSKCISVSAQNNVLFNWLCIQLNTFTVELHHRTISSQTLCTYQMLSNICAQEMNNVYGFSMCQLKTTAAAVLTRGDTLTHQPRSQLNVGLIRINTHKQAGDRKTNINHLKTQLTSSVIFSYQIVIMVGQELSANFLVTLTTCRVSALSAKWQNIVYRCLLNQRIEPQYYNHHHLDLNIHLSLT